MIDYNELNEALTKKKSGERLKQYLNIMNDALFSTEPLFKTDCLEQDYKEFWYLMRHAEYLWDDAVRLLRQESYASSVFFAIVCLEEIGKLSIARRQIDVNEDERLDGPASVKPPKRSPLYSHPKKHQLAAFSGFAVNSRADRVLGLNNIITLLELAESGKLEDIRQNCIYSRTKKGAIVLPLTSRKKNDAAFFCSVAGELLAEIGGLEPHEFERLLARVVEFEEEFPLNGYELQMTA
ncbi:MAG: AbiV family abortive infection protein [Gammaproteobacteria bacterium]